MAFPVIFEMRKVFSQKWLANAQDKIKKTYNEMVGLIDR